MNIENLLTQLLILKGLTEQQRQKILAIGEIEQYQYGEHIFDEGTENHALYDDMDLFWKALDDKSRPIKF